MTPQFTPEEITYQLFDMDPAEFYKDRFACGIGLDNALAEKAFLYEIDYEKVRCLIDDLKKFLPRGGKVLDIGCGAGPYGPTILANVPGIMLYGVDMSEECLRQAKLNKYSQTALLHLPATLPFEDEYFDAAFSMDLFGHIEFRHKNILVREIARVTKTDGLSHHGAETGYVDYFHCNPKDPKDPIRKFVYVDGHIGAEPMKHLCSRFAKHFRTVVGRPTYLYPFLRLTLFAGLFEPEFQEAVAEYKHAEATRLGNVLLGKLNRYFLELYSRVFGSAFEPWESTLQEISAEHEEARTRIQSLIDEHNHEFGIDFVRLPRELFRGVGFSSITCIK